MFSSLLFFSLVFLFVGFLSFFFSFLFASSSSFVFVSSSSSVGFLFSSFFPPGLGRLQVFLG